MLRRKAYGRLMDWKEHGKKPLLVSGQRQVGKTYIIKKFAEENFSEVLYIDLSRDREYLPAFQKDNLHVDDIMLSIGSVGHLKNTDPNDFVLILDEIQECEGALASLKSFALDGRYRVIASGSMLGVSLNHRKKEDELSPLSPMGYAEPYMMTSLDFEEFLWSQDIPEESIEHVRDCVKENKPIQDAIFLQYSRMFRLFMIVGGMPASVEAFNSDKKTFKNSSDELDSILAQIHRDINRYNYGVDVDKTAQCFNSIPYQLSQTNKKFHYSRIEGENAYTHRSADRFMGNLFWIKGAGYGNFVYGLNQIAAPIVGQTKLDVFKVYMSDTGLLTHMYGPTAIAAIYESEYRFNRGAVTENVVAECLSKCGYRVAYYQKKDGKARMEVDFAIDFIKGPVAIEVKSGKERDSPSIEKAGEHFIIHKRVKLEDSNISVDDKGIIHLPLFASAFIDSLDEIPDYLKKKL